jgi:catechol 2,3-dioxygenase-like lactoylglutathione lyase family enzyme
MEQSARAPAGGARRIRAGTMIDHVSLGVSDLAASKRFYGEVLGAIGWRMLADRAETVGFGKKYPEFWLNARPGMAPVSEATGVHVCLRVPDANTVAVFYATALAAGARADGAPGLRPEYHDSYYAAFIRDPDGNRIEVVTFTEAG